jgi:hypothetical protein
VVGSVWLMGVDEEAPGFRYASEESRIAPVLADRGSNLSPEGPLERWTVVDVDALDSVDPVEAGDQLCVRATGALFDPPTRRQRTVAALEEWARAARAALLVDVERLEDDLELNRLVLSGLLRRLPDPSGWTGLVLGDAVVPVQRGNQPRHLQATLRLVLEDLASWSQVSVVDAGPFSRTRPVCRYEGTDVRHWFELPPRAAGQADLRRWVQHLVDHRCFAGPELSDGDAWLARCAAGLVAPDPDDVEWALWSHHLEQLTRDVEELARAVRPPTGSAER